MNIIVEKQLVSHALAWKDMNWTPAIGELSYDGKIYGTKVFVIDESNHKIYIDGNAYFYKIDPYNLFEDFIWLWQ